MRARGIRIVAVVALAVAVTGIWVAAVSAPPATVESEVRQIAGGLRCPTCIGESVADSTAPVAVAMRDTITQQVRAGASPERVRAWFTQRYGPSVLLDPAPLGAGLLLWLIPLLLILLAAILLTRRRSVRVRWAAAGVGLAVVGVIAVASLGLRTESASQAAESTKPPDSLRVLTSAVSAAPGDVALQLALAGSLDAAGRTDEALTHYAAAARLRPLDADVSYPYASALVRSGHTAEATTVLGALLSGQPDHADSLFLLGTLLWQEGDSRSGILLERFLRVAPDSPDAAEAKRMLGAPTGASG